MTMDTKTSIRMSPDVWVRTMTGNRPIEWKTFLKLMGYVPTAYARYDWSGSDKRRARAALANRLLDAGYDLAGFPYQEVVVDGTRKVAPRDEPPRRDRARAGAPLRATAAATGAQCAGAPPPPPAAGTAAPAAPADDPRPFATLLPQAALDRIDHLKRLVMDPATWQADLRKLRMLLRRPDRLADYLRRRILEQMQLMEKGPAAG